MTVEKLLKKSYKRKHKRAYDNIKNNWDITLFAILLQFSVQHNEDKFEAFIKPIKNLRTKRTWINALKFAKSLGEEKLDKYNDRPLNI